ncbi:MAG: molybdopterin molybdotransferase MoeA, partial [Actinomycetales bacterium]
LPGYPTSAMDGWAVSGPGPWRITGDVPAGQPLGRCLVHGEAVRIATGSVVPIGADAILRWEHADRNGDLLSGDVEAGRDIRRAGEECRQGELIAEAGSVLGPATIGLLAATGYDSVPVRRRPRVSVLLLGDELLTHGMPSGGRVRDSLGPQIPGWVARAGGIVVSAEHVPDTVAATGEALGRHSATCDLLITTGGTAAGPRDHLHAALDGISATVRVDRVRVKPGHPMLLAEVPTSDGTSTDHSIPLVGLPGNPHSAVVGLVTLVVPLLHGMLARPAAMLPRVPSVEGLHASPGHTRLIAGRLVDGSFMLSPYPGSAMLRGLAQSDGFAVVHRDVAPGAEVDWLPLP